MALFFLPGFAVALLVAVRRSLDPVRAVMLTVLAGSALGYAAFWAYFANHSLGRILSYGIAMSALVSAAVALRRHRRLRSLAREMARPFAYVLGLSVCSACFLFLFTDPFTSGVEIANVRFFPDVRPGDNQIPLIFAERIYSQQPVEPFCCGDWQSSDRPPLQAGIFLLERPFKLFGNVRLNYELLGIGLQCLWICGVWTLLKTLRAPAWRIEQVLGFLIFSGFLFYNSVYVWPKLLAAALLLFVVSILLEGPIARRPISWFDAGIAAISFALAMLAHPGSVFSAPALAFLAIRGRRFIGAPKLLAALALIVALIAPWIAYQKFYDPPGNRLLKMHLAGVGPVDSRSAWRAIRDTYGALDLKTIASYKWANVRTLVGPHPFLVGPSEESRAMQRDYLWNAIGVLNAGWVAMLVLLFRKRPAALRYSGLLVGMTAINLLAWCVALIGPAYTVTEHGSYADVLLLSVGLIGFLLRLPRGLLAALFALQVLNLFLVWVFVKPASISGGHLQIGLLIAGLACAAGLMWPVGKSIWRRPGPASLSASPEYPLPD
jgi:hypothetical protein